MKYTISKQFAFSASHQLEHLPSTHPCSRLHGHNYLVEIILQAGKLDERGFVLDYNDLSLFGELIATKLDHRHLNEVLPFYTTAENIAQYLYSLAKKYWPCVLAVKVSETPKTWAIYEE
jgi:6-pyruvoyltetrahydropterin/6-carboxytetrahydropterin synthase